MKQVIFEKYIYLVVALLSLFIYLFHNCLLNGSRNKTWCNHCRLFQRAAWLNMEAQHET